MIFKKLELEDKEKLERFLKPYKFKTCEYAFTSLFIWRKAFHIEYTIFKEALIIKKIDASGEGYFMQPVGYTKENLKEIVEELMRYKEEYKFKYLFKEVEEDFLKDLWDCCHYSFNIAEDRDNFDYIYDSSSLIKLSGRKLKNQKNHYNNFVKNNIYRITNIEEDEVSACVNLSKEWYEKRGDGQEKLLHEVKAIEELLRHRKLLNLKAMAVYVNEKLAGFTIGERIKEEMAIIHIEKADAGINGLYNFINKTFVEEYFNEVTFINREQDLGLEGLRAAKLGYKPVKLEPKYIVN